MQDPTADEDLSKRPLKELREWLEAERQVLASFMVSCDVDKVVRARWAKERAAKLEAELRRRRLLPQEPDQGE